MWQRLKEWARRIKRDIVTLFVASRDPRTPRLAKIIALVVVCYALSPIDLIPDFIPVIGYLDDIILLPLGITLAVRLIPDPLLEEFRLSAETVKPMSRQMWGIALVLTLWSILALLVWLWLQG